MKTQAGSFGFEELLTYLLPGFILLAALLIPIDEHVIDSHLDNVKDLEFLTVFVFIAVISLLGAAIASIQAFIETHYLDVYTRNKIGLRKDEYDCDWNNYIKTLSERSMNNSYISRVVLFYQFETRLGLSLIFLACAFIFSKDGIHAIFAIIIAFIFYKIGTLHHIELGEYRKENFAHLRSCELSSDQKEEIRKLARDAALKVAKENADKYAQIAAEAASNVATKHK